MESDDPNNMRWIFQIQSKGSSNVKPMMLVDKAKFTSKQNRLLAGALQVAPFPAAIQYAQQTYPMMVEATTPP